MHAFLHKLRYDKFGDPRDYRAYTGLRNLRTAHLAAIKAGGLLGAAKAHGGFYFSRGSKLRKFFPGEEPEGWERVESNKGHYFAVIRKEKNPELDGRATRTARYWFTDETQEGQFSLDAAPKGWRRGRPKKSLSAGPET